MFVTTGRDIPTKFAVKPCKTPQKEKHILNTRTLCNGVNAENCDGLEYGTVSPANLWGVRAAQGPECIGLHGWHAR